VDHPLPSLPLALIRASVPRRGAGLSGDREEPLRFSADSLGIDAGPNGSVVGSGWASIYSMTRTSGALRSGSEITFVSIRIIQAAGRQGPPGRVNRRTISCQENPYGIFRIVNGATNG
jgi:hypothetical protein